MKSTIMNKIKSRSRIRSFSTTCLTPARHLSLNPLPTRTRNRNPTRDLCFNRTGSEGSGDRDGTCPTLVRLGLGSRGNVPLVPYSQPLRAMPQMPHF